jgi:ubiquinone/menaquinone biosynthesis C-methylase UbiE
MPFEKQLRAIVPSTAALTYNPAFKILSSAFDIFPKIIFKEFRNLPPNYMRIRIGAGNRLFANQIVYLTAAQNFWYYMFAHEMINNKSTIVDIGSGCGRYAHHIRDYIFKGEMFTGKYHGIDIDNEMLEWCRKNFDDRFQFTHSSHTSKTYENTNPGDKFFRLPLNDDSADLVFSTSLYTHLLENEIENYTRESFRVLKDGAYMAMYVFSMDSPPPTFGGRHTFAHRIGPAYVESLENPEAAVAFKDKYLLDLAKRCGFEDAKIVTVKGEAQPMFLARKGKKLA